MTTTVYDAAVDAILDNYADAIEGGNAYRGSGTVYNGVAGYSSPDELAGDTVTATGNGTTTTVVSTTIDATSAAEKLVRERTPPMFLKCLTQVALTGNVGYARKITAFNGVSTYTVAPGFANATASGDTFELLEGFKRAPASQDIMGSGAGFDRFFELALLPGSLVDMLGSGRKRYRGELELSVRFEKRGNQRAAKNRALASMQWIRSVIDRGELRDGTYVDGIIMQEAAPTLLQVDDQTKYIAVDRYPIEYRLTATYG